MVKEISTETSLLDVMNKQYEDNIITTNGKPISYGKDNK